VTYSGQAGSPPSDGVHLTRREARALRDAEEAAQAAAADVLAVPVPSVPIVGVSPDLAAVVDSATPQPDAADAEAHESAVDNASLSRPETSPPGATAPGLAAPESLPSESSVYGVPVPPRARRLVSRPSATARPTAPRSARAAGSRRPVAKIVTLLAIPAMFLTAALPAYAFAPQGASSNITASPAGAAQGLTVAAAAAAVSISTDGFTATSQAELDDIEAGLQADIAQQKAAEAARASAADYSVVGIRAEGDDYPWASAATEAQGGGLSPLGYYYRECVDFVAWRLNRDAGTTGSPWKWTWSSMTPGGGNASAWASGWASKGWPTSKSPVVGAVAWFTYNHVAYVQSVPGDGTVVLEEYNWMGSHTYHTRTVPISEVPLYLYPPS